MFLNIVGLGVEIDSIKTYPRGKLIWESSRWFESVGFGDHILKRSNAWLCCKIFPTISWFHYLSCFFQLKTDQLLTLAVFISLLIWRPLSDLHSCYSCTIRCLTKSSKVWEWRSCWILSGNLRNVRWLHIIPWIRFDLFLYGHH